MRETRKKVTAVEIYSPSCTHSHNVDGTTLYRCSLSCLPSRYGKQAGEWEAISDTVEGLTNSRGPIWTVSPAAQHHTHSGTSVDPWDMRHCVNKTCLCKSVCTSVYYQGALADTGYSCAVSQLRRIQEGLLLTLGTVTTAALGELEALVALMVSLNSVKKKKKKGFRRLTILP